MSIVMIATALALAGDGPPQPRVYEKVRSDGVTVVCVRHERKPTVMTARTECKPANQWRVSTMMDPQGNSPAGTYATEFAFKVPRATPRLIGK